MDINLLIRIIQWFLILVITVLILVIWYSSKNHDYWKKRGVPYEKPYPLFGNLEGIMRKSVWNIFRDLYRKHPTDYVGVYLGPKPALVVQSSELARQILVKDQEYFQNRYSYAGYASDPLGSLNLFTVKNPIWSNMRHEVSPMFTSARLKMITELMNINSRELVRKIQRDYVENNKTVNLKELFSMYTSDTVAYTVFGLRTSILNDEPSPLWTITKHMVKWTFRRGFEFTMVFLVPSVAELLRLTFFSKPATEYIKKIFWDVVKERKMTGTNDKDLLNILLKLKENCKLPAEANSQFADDLMLAQAAVFILGSIETSASTLSYCLHELAHHSDIQEKLCDEISDALKQSEKDVLEYADLLELKYLSACIFETLRKYSPVPHLDRVCNKRYQLNDDLVIEKGTPVFVNVVAIHHDERHYPEPEQWRPDRSTVNNDNDNVNFTFLPFGEGPRFCIGKRYGMMQIRAALAQILSKYKLEPGAEPYDLEADPYSLILTPKSGGSVKFIPRR